MSGPTFHDWAQHYRKMIRVAENEGGLDVRAFKEAERHARLLQQIWEWANKPIPESTEHIGHATPRLIANCEGWNKALAHVRSLLVGQQEKT